MYRVVVVDEVARRTVAEDLLMSSKAKIITFPFSLAASKFV
jgi:hypothetical protein